MAKEIRAKVKINIPAGGATPAPPVGQILGPHGINIMDFCKQFNMQTASRKGETVPVDLTIYKDRSFDFILKTPPTSELIRKKCNVAKGSSRPPEKIGAITQKDVEDIARVKMPDLNALNLDQAKKIIMGTARSMGIEVVD